MTDTIALLLHGELNNIEAAMRYAVEIGDEEGLAFAEARFEKLEAEIAAVTRL